MSIMTQFDLASATKTNEPVRKIVQPKAEPTGFASRMMSALGRGMDELRVYEIPKTITPKAISLESSGSVKITTDLISTTGLTRERDIYVVLSPENYQMLWDMKIAYPHLVASEEKSALDKLTSALGKMRGGFSAAVEGIIPAALRTSRAAGLNDMLPHLEIKIDTAGYRRGNDVSTLSTSGNLEGSVRFTGMENNAEFQAAGNKIDDRFAYDRYGDSSLFSAETRALLKQPAKEPVSNRPAFSSAPTFSIG